MRSAWSWCSRPCIASKGFSFRPLTSGTCWTLSKVLANQSLLLNRVAMNKTLQQHYIPISTCRQHCLQPATNVNYCFIILGLQSECRCIISRSVRLMITSTHLLPKGPCTHHRCFEISCRSLSHRYLPLRYLTDIYLSDICGLFYVFTDLRSLTVQHYRHNTNSLCHWLLE